MKIGILLSRFPYPLEKGDKLRAYHQIRELSKKHEIYLCTINTTKLEKKSIDQLRPFCKEVKIIKLSKFSILINLLHGLVFTSLPLQVAYFYQKSSKNKVQQFFKNNHVDHIYCQLIRVSEYVRDLHSIPRTIDYMDALSRGMERRLEKASLFTKPLIQLETTRLKKYEHFVFSSFNNHTIISEQDRSLIVHARNSEISIIRNGVDQNYFKAEEAKKTVDLLFTGNMSYPPNVDGVSYLVERILPLVWEVNPNIKLGIIGAKPSSKVLRLQSERVFVSGWVDDMRPYYSKSKIFVAPMLIGTGLQNKLLEAMAMRIPCITTPLANNALKATPGESILIANNPEEFKESILNLLNNHSLADEIATTGFNFISQEYSWESSTNKIVDVFLNTNKVIKN